MKKSYLLIIVLLSLFIQPSVFGQQVQNISGKSIPAEKAAEGQTKWMISKLKLDKQLYSLIYNTNFKYQLKGDSIHFSNMSAENRNKLYLLYSNRKKDELKKILSPQSYSEYLLVLEDIKSQATKR